MMISYAQNYEDVMLARVFRGKTDGFYIDVGAAHPLYSSVTKHFYNLGWRGINVEPIRAFYDQLVEDRPRDINLQVALVSCRERKKIYNISDEWLSTMDPANAEKAVKLGGVLMEEEIDVLTLAEVSEKYSPPEGIDFLKVDVEGWEEHVLRGADWDRFRPRVVLVESTLPNSPTLNHQSWEWILLEKRYKFVYLDGLNRFYLREEDADLKVHFATPPNVFDDFRLHREWDLEQQVQHWKSQHERDQIDLGAEREARARLADENARLSENLRRTRWVARLKRVFG